MRRTLLFVPILLIACGAPDTPVAEPAATEASSLEIAGDIEQRLSQYATADLTGKVDALPESERAALDHILAASRLMDDIFLRQAWVGNPELRTELEASDDPAAAKALEYFEINFGPWDRLAEMGPYIGDAPHPDGAGYYPEDMTAEELEAWIAANPQDEEAMRGLFTLVRRDGDALVTVPYSEAYREWLEPAAEHLRAAAEATENESLATFLRLRADAFGSDDYYESDLAWMDLDAPLEVTIGPYEVYEDGLFAYKAAFEAFVTVDDAEASAALAGFKAELPWLERNLPIADEHKNLDRGAESPIRVVDIVYTGGDTKSGVQTIAFNLPNDERVREAKGSKKVLLRNIIQAKFEKILVPIAERVLAEELMDRLSFEAFFGEVLHHELSHGLGPGMITVDGEQTEVRLALRELYSTMEEAKADVMGVYNILALIDKGVIDESMRDTIDVTYLAGLFRSARFGLHEAHGRGVVSQFNYLHEKGAIEVDDDGRYHLVSEKFPEVMESLLYDLLMLQATGDYEGTATFLDTYGVATPELEAAIGRLDDVPVDIAPRYPQAE